jgi:hypothetical protein
VVATVPASPLPNPRRTIEFATGDGDDGGRGGTSERTSRAIADVIATSSIVAAWRRLPTPLPPAMVLRSFVANVFVSFLVVR